jgi:hypothetical protein
MAPYDMGEWPLVRVRVAGAAEVEAESWAPFGAFAEALDRGDPFAVLIEFPVRIPRPTHPPERMKWLKDSRPALAARCRGVAYVMASPEGVAHAERFVDAARNAFACPVEVFGDRVAAAAWARGELGSTA